MAQKEISDKDAKWVWGKTTDLEKDWTLGEQLGQPGQFGVAKLCTRKKDGKKFAVKIIDKTKFLYNDAGVDSVTQDMKNEINVMKVLNHANIIKLHEVYEDKFNLYIVQELCSGGELFDRITAKGSYSEKDAAEVLHQMLEGILHMHKKEIVHADLKPDNFLFKDKKEDAKLKIIDFGMAKRVPRTRFLTNMCGTPYYTAPEVINGQYHKAADLWSVGVVMFVMLFGYPPFYVDPEKYGERENEMIYKKIKKGFVPVTKKGFGRHFPSTIQCSDEAKDLMKMLLRKDVAKRYTALEALDHQWFKKAKSYEKQISKQVLSSLQQFQKANKFKLVMLNMFSDEIDEKQRKKLQEAFDKMDENKDGKISLKEFKNHMLKLPNMSEAKVEAMFKSVDVDNDNEICFREILLTVADMQLRSVAERMYKIFVKIDENKDGYLSKEEIEKHMNQVKNDEWFKKLNIKPDEAFKAADANGDGQISYAEFLRAIQPEGAGGGALGGSDDEEKDSENDAPFAAADLGNALKEVASQGSDKAKDAADAAAAKKSGSSYAL